MARGLEELLKLKDLTVSQFHSSTKKGLDAFESEKDIYYFCWKGLQRKFCG